jgi:Ca2+-binding EF-hand superfamily protein
MSEAEARELIYAFDTTNQAQLGMKDFMHMIMDEVPTSTAGNLAEKAAQARKASEMTSVKF